MFKKTIKFLFTPKPITKTDIIMSLISAVLTTSFFTWFQVQLEKDISKMNHVNHLNDIHENRVTNLKLRYNI